MRDSREERREKDRDMYPSQIPSSMADTFPFPLSPFPLFSFGFPWKIEEKNSPFGVVSFPSLPSDFRNNFFPCSALHGLNFPAPQGALNRIESGIGSTMM